jgi:tetratricopeptide (TPR) repeat protein
MGKGFADRWGVPVRADKAEAVALLDEAIEDLAALAGDPVWDIAAAVAADDGLVLGHIFRAYLALYGTTPEGVATAAEILKRLDEAVIGEREAHHLRAARSWAEGDWEAATRSLERALLCHPRDLLALKVAQDLYFFLGNRLELRDSAARVLPAWPHGLPGWGYVQGIYAFGLEENAEYRQAESRARAALDHNPKDVWSVHALAHVFEMEGSHRDGVDFLTASGPDWSGSYFAIHNWWHRCLYHLSSARSTRRPGSTTPPSGPAGPPSGWTWWTPRRCCGGCGCSGWTSPTVPRSSRPTSTTWSASPSTSSTTGTRSWRSAWRETARASSASSWPTGT